MTPLLSAALPLLLLTASQAQESQEPPPVPLSPALLCHLGEESLSMDLYSLLHSYTPRRALQLNEWRFPYLQYIAYDLPGLTVSWPATFDESLLLHIHDPNAAEPYIRELLEAVGIDPSFAATKQAWKKQEQPNKKDSTWDVETDYFTPFDRKRHIYGVVPDQGTRFTAAWTEGEPSRLVSVLFEPGSPSPVATARCEAFSYPRAPAREDSKWAPVARAFEDHTVLHLLFGLEDVALQPAQGAGAGRTFLLPAPNVGWADEHDVAEMLGCEACEEGWR